MSLIAYLRCDFKMSSGIAVDRVWSGNSAMGTNRLPADRVIQSKLNYDVARAFVVEYSGIKGNGSAMFVPCKFILILAIPNQPIFM